MTERERLEYCHQNNIPVQIRKHIGPYNSGGFGLFAVIDPDVYDEWYEEVGKRLGYPKLDRWIDGPPAGDR